MPLIPELTGWDPAIHTRNEALITSWRQMLRKFDGYAKDSANAYIREILSHCTPKLIRDTKPSYVEDTTKYAISLVYRNLDPWTICIYIDSSRLDCSRIAVEIKLLFGDRFWSVQKIEVGDLYVTSRTEKE